jgi:hypothetical protein
MKYLFTKDFLANYKPLTVAEFAEFLRLAKAGDVRARNRLILQMRPWIVSKVGTKPPYLLGREDMYDSALDAIYIAIESFNMKCVDRLPGIFTRWCNYNFLGTTWRIVYERMTHSTVDLDGKLRDQDNADHGNKDHNYFVEQMFASRDMADVKMEENLFEFVMSIVDNIPEKQRIALLLRYGLRGEGGRGIEDDVGQHNGQWNDRAGFCYEAIGLMIGRNATIAQHDVKKAISFLRKYALPLIKD